MTTDGSREAADRRRADEARQVAVDLVDSLGLGYLGQVMSAAELLTVAMGGWLRPGVDRFVLSPAHYVTAVYAVGVAIGGLDRDALADYGRDGSTFETIGTESTPLVDFTCGSLAQGLSVGIGYALAARLTGSGARTLVFMSDGEMEEGQLWEAAMFAAHHGLDDLFVVIDCNGSQVDGPVTSVTTIEPIADKWESFGWQVAEVDGHDPVAIAAALDGPGSGRPRVVIGRTTTSGHLESLAAVDDAHFITMNPELTEALTVEIAERV